MLYIQCEQHCFSCLFWIFNFRDVIKLCFHPICIFTEKVNCYFPFCFSEKSPAQAIKKEREDSEITAESPQDNEFISDAFQDDQISEEDLKKEMEMLGVEDGKFKDEGEKALFAKAG